MFVVFASVSTPLRRSEMFITAGSRSRSEKVNVFHIIVNGLLTFHSYGVSYRLGSCATNISLLRSE
jgi:hypothetical protein